MAVPSRVIGIFATVLLVLAVIAPVRAAEVQRVISDEGIEAWLVEDDSNPMISLELAFRDGAALDPEGRAGLANLVAGLLDEGAGELDSQAFQARLEENSIRLSFSASRDSFRGSLQTLNETREEAFELLSLAVNAPRFDEEPVGRVKGQVLSSLAARSQRPTSVAGDTMARLLFPGHPYGRPVDGTPESVRAIDADDLRHFAATRFARDRLVVGVSGDITPEELKPLLDKAFAELPETAEAAPEVPDARMHDNGDIVIVERPGPQAWIAFAHRGIARDHPDYYAASLVNYILGGGSFISRLTMDIRQDRGMAYSVYTYLDPREYASLMAGGLGTANFQAGEALEVLRDNWARMAEEGPTEKELEDAKTYMTGSFPLRLSSTSNIASILTAIQIHELGIDYMDQRSELIERVDMEQARRVARELLDPERLTVVIVGAPEGVEATRPVPEESS